MILVHSGCLIFLLMSVSINTYEAEPIAGSARLVVRDGVTSPSLTAGRLEVYYNGQWGTVCNSSFGEAEALTACRQLGFTEGYLDYGSIDCCSRYRFEAASNTTPTWLGGLTCSSSDTSLDDCLHNGIGVNFCSHKVYVSCLGNGAVRLNSLFSTPSSSAGRLEVYWNGEWGTVCSNSFGRTEADLVCRQLGFASAYSYGSDSTFGFRYDATSYYSSTQILLDGLSCSSSNTTLSQCSLIGIGEHDCSHSQDVFITCLSNGTLRLQGSSLTTSGRLELFWNGEWRTVCDDYYFGQVDADVACRQLGFISASSYGSVSDFGYSQGNGTVLLNHLRCTSSDRMLYSCRYSGLSVDSCKRWYEYAAISCSTFSTVCSSGEFRCPTGVCVDAFGDICDGTDDCGDGSDETYQVCLEKQLEAERRVNKQAQYKLDISVGVSVGIALIIAALWLVVLAMCMLIPRCPLGKVYRSKPHPNSTSHTPTHSASDDEPSHPQSETESIPLHRNRQETDV